MTSIPTVTWNNPSLVGFPNPSVVTIRYQNDNDNTQITPTVNQDGKLQFNFQRGRTSVRAIATDSDGNEAVCRFDVTFTPTGLFLMVLFFLTSFGTFKSQ